MTSTGAISTHLIARFCKVGYHYYPPLEQVRAWLGQALFSIIEEGEGDGYHHFLARKGQ